MAKKVSTKNESILDAQPTTSHQREQHIAVAAYYCALQRGFAQGDPVADWLQAEQEIDAGLLNPPRQRTVLASREPLPEQPTATSQASLLR